MKKILFVITGLGTGGAEVMLYNLLNQLNRDKFSPTVVSMLQGGVFVEKIEALNIPVFDLGMQPGELNPVALFKLIRLLKQIQPDVIQGWMYHANVLAQLSNLFTAKKPALLWSIHHSIHDLPAEKPLTQGIIRFGSLLSRHVNKVAFVSEKSLAQHLKLGYCQANSCVIPNGFDTTKFQPSAEIRQKFRQELGISEKTFLIGSVARYAPMKDQANFIKAAQILLAEYPETKFVMLGTDVDHNNQNLTNLIEELDIGENVYLLGERRDIPQITPALDILSSSSAYGEAFPLVIGEAMSCEVPCVVTNIGDSASIVGDTGKVVPPKDSLALARAWQEIITMDASARANLGESARSRILEKFSLGYVVSQYEHLYQSVVGDQS